MTGAPVEMDEATRKKHGIPLRATVMATENGFTWENPPAPKTLEERVAMLEMRLAAAGLLK